MTSQRILVTGAAGYIGSSLVRQLLERGYSVVGIDKLMFGDESIRELKGHDRFELHELDLREHDTWKPLLKEVDGIVHLAAIVGDPACSKWPDLAKQTNLDVPLALFEEAASGNSVKRFIFSSTCSNYGRNTELEYCTEDTSLSPLSLYSETKVEVELHLLGSKTRSDFVPTALRFATAFGLSHRMRFDLTVNEFAREVAMGRELEIYGEQFWRPYCHAKELARACIAVLEADDDKVDHTVFNVGATDENWTKKMIAELLLEFDPNANIKYVRRDEDPRDYKVSFDRIRETLNFTPDRTVRKGVTDLMRELKSGTFADPYAAQYRNS